MMLINMKIDISGCNRLTFQGYRLLSEFSYSMNAGSIVGIPCGGGDTQTLPYALADPRGERPRGAPPWPKYFLISCSFGEILKKLCVVPPPRGFSPHDTKILDPPLIW